MHMGGTNNNKLMCNGLIPGVQTNSRIRLLNPNYQQEESPTSTPHQPRVILYARVSSTINKPSLNGQIKRLQDYAAARGYIIVGEYQEIASGLNDNRHKLDTILKRDDYDILLVEPATDSPDSDGISFTYY